MLGHHGISESAISSLPDNFSAEIDLDTKHGSHSIIEVASFFDRALIEKLHKYPDDLRVINRQRFEELIAELFSGFGYQVELTKKTRDGGIDIIAIRNLEVEARYIIQCKRPDPGNPVGISTVRELYGVKEDDGATKAILATTTYFTSDAKIFFEKHRWTLEPKDFDAIKIWIARYLKVIK